MFAPGAGTLMTPPLPRLPVLSTSKLGTELGFAYQVFESPSGLAVNETPRMPTCAQPYMRSCRMARVGSASSSAIPMFAYTDVVSMIGTLNTESREIGQPKCTSVG